MRRQVIAGVLAGGALLLLPLAHACRADDKGGPGPIQVNSADDLEKLGRMLFKLADTNNDNRISQKEAIDAGNLLVGGFFFRADANGDGTVTRQEADAAREALFQQQPLFRFVFERGKSEIDRQGNQNPANQTKQKVMDTLDANHDGNLSAQEVKQAVQTGVQSLFLTADRNGDGQLDPAEVNDGIVEVGRWAFQAAFNAADTDKNGAVSQDEFDRAIVNPAHVLFRIVDANNDNQISRDELSSATQILMQHLRAMQVPEPPNSLSNRLKQGNSVSVPIAPVTTTPTAAVPGAVAPTATIPPQR
jgi:Ca2+-binding EF-hand superfamily protein